uniref:Secreted protein n=1 Tax=Plectus sambesii TaxID=2011161 RepID=A0A914WMQ1_9BILA
MLRFLLALSVVFVIVQSQTTKKSSQTTQKFVPLPPCLYPYYVQGSFKTGKTNCTLKTIATDCADAVADCIFHPYTKKTSCCKPSTTAVWPKCPNKKTLQFRNNNPSLKAGIPCNPPSKKGSQTVNSNVCGAAYACVLATNNFTRTDYSTANVCCSLK